MAKRCGIYTITNLTNNKIYVGRASSLYNRLWSHLDTLRKGIHVNDHLQKSFNEYGEENFLFETLEECNKQFLVSQEHYWATILNAHNPDFGYNIVPTNPNGKGFKRAEETSYKLKICGRKERIFTHILQYTMDGDFIKEWDSVGHVCKTLGFKNSGLKIALSKGNNSFKGYMWRREGSDLPIKKITYRSTKPLLQFTVEGKFIKEWDNRKEVEDSIGIKIKNLQSVLAKNGKKIQKTAGGFKWLWRYNLENKDKIKELGLDIKSVPKKIFDNKGIVDL